MKLTPRWRSYGLAGTLLVIIIVLASTLSVLIPALHRRRASQDNQHAGTTFNQNDLSYWATIPQRYPVTSFKALPTPKSGSIRNIQAAFGKESSQDRNTRLQRQAAVKGNFTHAWNGYKKHAWLHDEVAPLSGHGQDPFGGWAATLVDALDTLWIMGLQDEFEKAVTAVDALDFTKCPLDEINLFETNIRYLGGILAAYDISGGKYDVLLKKADEVGAMLYRAFDTPNRMPVTRWQINGAGARGSAAQEALNSTLLAEIGTFTLEFTRLSQLTGKPQYFDAVQRITDILDAQQAQTKLPGLWPVTVNAQTANFTESDWFAIGGGGDSAFEYLPKQHILLGGATDQYRHLYEQALGAMERSIFFKPVTRDRKDILFPGSVNSDGTIPTDQLQILPQTQHLSCFSGGMVGLAAKAFGGQKEMAIAKQLVEGCLWGYEAMAQGVFPDAVQMLPCDNATACPWDENKWLDAMNQAYGVTSTDDAESKLTELGLPIGVMAAPGKEYWLRPEAIESVFIYYRITGDRSYQDRAWKMFNTIMRHTTTPIAHASLSDCTVAKPPQTDNMQSFWLAETLKYFYLIFSEPDVISLDEYVLNTEAHPLKRSV